MRILFAVLAVLSLTACASSSADDGPRADWLCDRGAAFSARIKSSGDAEVFAAGRLYTLEPASGGGFADDDVTYTPQTETATLTGAFGGPYVNCRKG